MSVGAKEKAGAPVSPPPVAAVTAAPPPAPEVSEVEWYKPELGNASKEKSSRVVITGHAEKGAKVSLKADKIPVVGADNSVELVAKENVVVKQDSVTADKDGYFEITLDLPLGMVQLPLEIDNGSGAPVKNYEVKMAVEKQAVTMASTEPLKASPYRQSNKSVWLGVGFNYLKYNQTTSTLPSNLTFETIKLPSLYLGGTYHVNTKWSAMASYSISKGATSSSSQVAVSSGDFLWKIASLEAIYWPERWRKEKSRVGVMAGVQHHSFPFLNILSTSPATATIENATMMVADLGAFMEYTPRARWTYEAFLAYQYPLADPNEFSIKPQFLFNGSVGAYYRYRPNLYLGGFWYGQLHKYSFDQNNAAIGTRLSGKQDLFYSNIEFRVGYEL